MASGTERLIKVWPFYEAPEEFQSLSPHGGDEDWIAFVPLSIGPVPAWLTKNGYGCFGVCDTSRHEVEGGTIFIGAHS